MEEFLVKATIGNGIKYFGPFKSLRRAEETLAKVCQSFEECDLLKKNTQNGPVVSLTRKFFE